MKLLIASDIHGSAFWCRRLCDLIETEPVSYTHLTLPTT